MDITIVFVVSSGHEEEFYIEGVFSTYSAAEEFVSAQIAAGDITGEVEPYVLDNRLSEQERKELVRYCFWLDSEGNEVNAHYSNSTMRCRIDYIFSWAWRGELSRKEAPILHVDVMALNITEAREIAHKFYNCIVEQIPWPVRDN